MGKKEGGGDVEAGAEGREQRNHTFSAVRPNAILTEVEVGHA